MSFISLLRIATLGVAAGLGACSTSTMSYNQPVDTGREASQDAAVDTGNFEYDAEEPIADVRVAPADVQDVQPRNGPPYPVILHHGFAGFRDFGGINYFYRVAADLRARGAVVYEAEVSPFNPPSIRAVELAAFVDQVLTETNAAKVVIIGHSQGGLDPRYMISTLHYGDRVALLATVATPHRGTYVADALIGNVPGVTDEFINAVATVFGFAYNDVRARADLRQAANSLTLSVARDFNLNNPDDPRVAYWSWTGRSNRRIGERQCSGARVANDPFHVDDANVALYAFSNFLEQGDPFEHVNDGLVEVASGKWGIWMGCIPADHFDEVGQIARTGPVPGSGFDHIEFYRDIVRRVREAGF